MSEVEEWLSRVGDALAVPADEVLPEAVRAQLLALTGDIAHNVVRVAVPLTSFLMGAAVGRGVAPEEALRIVSGLLPSETEDTQ